MCRPAGVQHIYERYGIFTVLNHPLGRYGVTVDGVFHPNTDYSDPRSRDQLKSEVRALVDEFNRVPGVLMWLLGNGEQLRARLGFPGDRGPSRG